MFTKQNLFSRQSINLLPPFLKINARINVDMKTHPIYNQSIVFPCQNTESDRKDADMNPQITFIIADDEQNICTGLTNIIP